MTTNKLPAEIKEYAGGWITERKGTAVPGFLKYAYIVIALGCIGYLVHYRNGETAHGTRGALVRQLNQVSGNADLLMYGVAVLALLAAIGLFVFAFRKAHVD
ncbi:MAG: hypothetical protein HYX75_05600 [Acidobacteria bacterium]|nr:hypothetical protein [Acidobacteriota bacterium]